MLQMGNQCVTEDRSLLQWLEAGIFSAVDRWESHLLETISTRRGAYSALPPNTGRPANAIVKP
jgi:hypothetical protein